jgi:hypothetical protein
VKDWRERQRKATRDAKKRERWGTDERIDYLATIIQHLARLLPVQTDADRRLMGDESKLRADLEVQLRTADPSEVATARALVAEMKTRTA